MTEKLYTFIEEPTECPCCLYPLEKINDQLFCRNSACSAKVNKRLEHFCKVLNIKGLGPKTIEKLQIQEISELYYLDLDDMIKVLGEKVALKLQDEIEKSKTASLETVLAALSIPLIGETASTKICAVVKHISEINQETCKKAGLGEKATFNLLEWLNTEGKDVIPFLPFSLETKIKPNVTANKSVCITGKLKSFKKKSDATEALLAAGYKLVDSVTKTTDYLINESGSYSAKVQTAEKYGIPIITDLNDLLKETK
jgi:DNA ligase (NAD+)